MATLRLIPEDGGKPHEVTEPVMLGRDASCEVTIPHGSVSRRHARIEPRAGGWAVIDQASANGTFLDGLRVADVGLRDGHVLRLGAVSFRVELEDAELDGEATVTEGAAIPAHLVPESARHIGAPAPTATPPPVPAPRPSAPPPPAPAPRTAAAAPPPVSAPNAGPAGASRRGLLFWVGGGCLGCLTILLLGVLSIGGGLYYLTQPPVNAVLEQLRALEAGQLDPVYEALDDSYREKMSRDEFVDFVARHPGLREYRDASISNWSLDNHRVTLSGTLTATSGEEEEASFRLVQRGGVWRITAIEVEGDEAP